VNQVVRITELAGWMVLPMYEKWDCSLAEIEDGPYAGKEVGVDGWGISLKDRTATVSGVFLTNAVARP
jgi:hypothetical protein